MRLKDLPTALPEAGPAVTPPGRPPYALCGSTLAGSGGARLARVHQAGLTVEALRPTSLSFHRGNVGDAREVKPGWTRPLARPACGVSG